MMKLLLAATTLSVILSATSYASDEHCPQHVFTGQQPVISQNLTPKTQLLCYEGFSLLHSGVTRTPLWVAEHLTRASVDASKPLQRPKGNVFHAEDRLSVTERAELSDYSRSGMDRGHMRPSGDASTVPQQLETFTLANMVPQNSQLNRNLWEHIESGVRSYAERTGEVYVVTGPAFIGNDLQALKGRVYVPTHLWKAIYNPRTQEGSAYWVANQNVDAYETLSLAELKSRSGIDAFPSASPAVKEKKINLPANGRGSQPWRNTSWKFPGLHW